MKKSICIILCLFIMLTPVCVNANERCEIYPYEYAFEDFWYTRTAVLDDVLPCRAALLMEASTGKILFMQNETVHLPVASVTKIMSTLLIMEAIDSGKLKLDDIVTVGEDAAKMGGSQIFLEVGEQMTLHELLKALVVASANDATVALAEHLSGSEASFVSLMNTRAAELGMKDTHFSNCHGLNEENHYSSAKDVAIMTQELLKHELVFEYTTIWMDTVRNGEFGLANTNKLIRFYTGANGMKTGFTDTAKYCLSGTALRNGMQLIAVVIGADASDVRFAVCKKLLDFGFANYAVFTPEKLEIPPVPVSGGTLSTVEADYIPRSILTEKGATGFTQRADIYENITAPVKSGDIIGEVKYFKDGEEIDNIPIVAAGDNPEITFFDILERMFLSLLNFI